MNNLELLQFILAVIEVREDMIQHEGKNPADYSSEYILKRVTSIFKLTKERNK